MTSPSDMGGNELASSESPRPIVSWTAPDPEAGPAPGVVFAPHGPRLLAYVLDGLILTIAITVIAVIAAIVLLAGSDFSDPRNPKVTGPALAGFVGVLTLFSVLALAYLPFFWMRSGQTPGMRPFDLYVVRDADGGRVTGGQAVLRLVGMWVSGVALGIGYLWVFVDKRHRGWHDLIASTVVVQRTPQA